MATVTGFTAQRMLEIEESSVTGGLVDVNGNLLLSTRGGDEINAGMVKGDKGDRGDDGYEGDSLPAGSITINAGTVEPPNWMFCDGRAISRATYASLFSAIGTRYGVGDGTTTFNIPDLRGRVAVGLDGTQTEFDLLGEKGGAKTHTLTPTEMPAHTHGGTAQTAGNHEHASSQVVIVNGQYQPAGRWFGSTRLDQYWNLLGGSGPDSFGSGVSYSGWAGDHTHSITTSSSGGGSAHNNLPPYLVTNYIIKLTNGNTPGDSQLATRMGVIETRFNEFDLGRALGGGVDLNNIIEPGIYHQSANTLAASGFNYPIARAGLLEVRSNGFNMHWQSYTLYGDFSKTTYKRAYYDGGVLPPGWSAWTADNAVTFPDTDWAYWTPNSASGFAANTENGMNQCVYRRFNGKVIMNIFIGKGSWTGAWVIWYPPAGFKPRSAQSHWFKGGWGAGMCEIRVQGDAGSNPSNVLVASPSTAMHGVVATIEWIAEA